MPQDITLDIFDGTGFKGAELTDWVNVKAPYVPGLVGSMPMMFPGEGVYTPTVQFDELNGSLTLIPSSPRGTPPSQSAAPKGTIRTFNTVRLAAEAPLLADQVASIRVLGQVGVLRTAQQLVEQRVTGPFGIKSRMGLTLEHKYLGSIDGLVLDADNSSVLYDFFALFGVSRPATQTFAFSGSTVDSGDYAKFLTGVKRKSVLALNGLDISQAMPVMLCGDNYYDTAWASKEIVNARKTGALGAGKNAAIEEISGNGAFDSFVYNRVLHINYRGSDQGQGTEDNQVGIDIDSGRFFYAGVPGLFQSYFAPADTWEFVNTLGLPSYLLQRPERQTSSQRTFEVQTNILPMNMRPLHVQRIAKS